MATLASGANATVSVNSGDILTVEPQEKATVKVENPSGSSAQQFNDKRSFGPFKTARNVKVTSVTGGVFYEVGTAKASGSLPLSIDLDLAVYWGTGAPSLSAGKGSIYIRLDGSSTSTRIYTNTDGATTWTAVTTAA